MSGEEEVLTPGQNIKPIISVEEVPDLIENLYGFKCLSVEQLNGYDDINYKVVVSSDGGVNTEYVCKIMNLLESKKPHLLDAQCALLLHMRSNGIPCQNIIRNRNGLYYSLEHLKSGKHAVRLLEYLPGSILHQIPITPSILFEAGKFVAQLDSAAKTFYHKGYVNYKSIWMLEEITNISKFLYAVKDIEKRKIVEEVVEEFNQRVVPLKNVLEKGLIHGDFNEQNLVVQNISGKWHITGILDFGDAHFDCYLFELAIAITYMMIVQKNIDAAGYVIAGYSTVRKPTPKEFSLLKVCVAARLCQSIVNSAYSILQDPKNVYILCSYSTANELLPKLWQVEEEMLLDRWKTIAESYENQ